MSVLIWILLSTILVSVISFIGVLTLYLKEKFLDKILHILISLSAGALLGGAFLHLLPEALEHEASAVSFVLVGFIVFFLIEKVFHWHHCHDKECKIHAFGYLNLLGDAIHNFVDGLIIAASFIMGNSLGIISVIAIILHEIPQELGDFGVLVYSGMNKKRALFLNFVTALTAVAGGLIGFFFLEQIQVFSFIILAFAAGGFIYVSASDLIPELKKETNRKKSFTNFIVFLIGILLMSALTFIG
ncbi:MAG: ZIP family metal transporter [archaeon]